MRRDSIVENCTVNNQRKRQTFSFTSGATLTENGPQNTSVSVSVCHIDFAHPCIDVFHTHTHTRTHLVQRLRSERLRVRSRRSATFTPSAHVRRQSLPVWPPTLNNHLYLLPLHTRNLHSKHAQKKKRKLHRGQILCWTKFLCLE